MTDKPTSTPVQALTYELSQRIEQKCLRIDMLTLMLNTCMNFMDNEPKDIDGYPPCIGTGRYGHGFEPRAAADLAERLFLGTPYLWGGRSTGGIDCSGLTQICFKAKGIWLPRDASQQATCGVEVCGCDVQRDDLAFFRNAEGRIIHVGICMGDGRIIHASGQVRIDTLDTRGILVEKTGTYSHTLLTIRRVK